MRNKFVLIFMLFLAACSAGQAGVETDVPIETLASTATKTNLPTETPTPTMTSTITPTLKPTYTPTATPDIEYIQLHRGIIYNIAISPGGDVLIVVTNNGVWGYQITTSELLFFEAGVPGISVPYSTVADIVWSPDGEYLAISQNLNGVWIWDTNSWELITEKLSGEYWRDARGNPGFGWSPDGEQLALGTGDGEVWIWNKSDNTWEMKDNKLAGLGWQLSVNWGRDGILQTLIDNELYNVETGDFIKNMFVYIDGIGRVVWSPSGEDIYFLFDLGGGLIEVETNEHLFGCCNNFFWSQDGQYIAVYSLYEAKIFVFDTISNEFVFESEELDVYALAWTPENQLIAALNNGDKLILQNIYTDEILFDLSAFDIR